MPDASGDPREAAAALLHAARTQNHAHFTEHLGALAKDIEAHVRMVVGRNARLLTRVPHLAADDVVQEVFQRLLKTPPSGEATNPLALVLAWAGTTTLRFLLDEATRPSATRRHRAAENAGDEAVSPMETNQRPDLDPRQADDPTSRAEAHSEIANVRRILAAQYPKGLQLLDAERAHPDEGDGVLATALGTSAANIQQIRHRRLRVLADALSGPERIDRP